MLSEQQLTQLNKKELVSLVLQQQKEISKLSEILACVKSLEKKVEVLESGFSLAENTSKLLKEHIFSLEKRQLAVEQYSRRECLEFVGINNNVPDDALEKAVCDVLKEVGVFSNPKVDLQACHRIGKQGTVITKFTNRKMVTNIMLNKNKLKGRVNGKMYINESLCQLNRKIRGACNSLLKQKRLNKLRSRYGMVSIQINEGEQFILIDHKNILTDNFPDIVLV
jgi:hypothetical protein